jgi:flagellar biosynthesis anti-sigma factor FlgM
MNGIGSSQLFSGVQEGLAPANAGKLARADADSPITESQSGQSGGTETTILSATAGMLASTLAGSDVRTGRVTALQQSIGAGTYNVSASDVAGKMLSALLN